MYFSEIGNKQFGERCSCHRSQTRRRQGLDGEPQEPASQLSEQEVDCVPIRRVNKEKRDREQRIHARFEERGARTETSGKIDTLDFLGVSPLPAISILPP